MYLRSRRATISVKAAGALSRSVPARPRGSREPLPLEWRSLTRIKTPRRRTSLYQLTSKSGKIDTKMRREGTKHTFSNPKKVRTIHFEAEIYSFSHFFVLITAHARASCPLGHMQTKVRMKTLVPYLSDYDRR